MTGTPWALAYDSMCAPTPESSASTTSTVAPLVMSVWASLNWVASLPSAFCTTYCDDVSPAFWKDSFRYGASNSTYRVDDTVSGRITATLPLPLEARGLSVAMAENVLSIWLSDSCGTAALLLLLLLPAEPLDELPQAAMTRAALPATAVSATLLVIECKGTTSLWAGTCQGCAAQRLSLIAVHPDLSGKTLRPRE